MIIKDICVGNEMVSVVGSSTLDEASEVIRSHCSLRGGSICIKIGDKNVLYPGKTLIQSISRDLFFIGGKPVETGGTMEYSLLQHIYTIHHAYSSMPSYTHTHNPKLPSHHS